MTPEQAEKLVRSERAMLECQRTFKIGQREFHAALAEFRRVEKECGEWKSDDDYIAEWPED